MSDFLINIPEANRRFIETNLIVDSRDRNTSLYPNSHSFNIKLNETIRRVYRIKLTKLNIDLSQRYLIHNYNNIIDIYDNTLDADGIPDTLLYTATIPIGDYIITGDTQINNIITAINTELGGFGAITLTLNETNNIITINNGTASEIYIRFRGGTNNNITNNDGIGNILGFEPNSYINIAASGTSDTNMRYCFKKSYGALFINDFGQNIGNNSNTNGSIVIIPINKSDIPVSSNSDIIMNYCSPIDNINTIIVRLVDYYGNPIDIHMCPLKFELILESEK